MSDTKKSWWHLFWYILAVPLSAFPAQQLWGWFVVPVTGFHVLTMLQALGLATTIKYLTFDYRISIEQNDDKDVRVAMQIVVPLVGLLMGWLIHVGM